MTRVGIAATLAAALVLASGMRAGAQTPAPQTPVFRGGVDLVTVDVGVVDAQGRVVTGLTAADFSIVAGKRERRIVSADYIAARGRPATAKTASAPALRPSPTSNVKPAAGRTFLFVFDLEEIERGGGTLAARAVGDYLDRLSPDDRVGLVAVPFGTPRVDLTTQHDLVRQAAQRVAGSSLRNQSQEMTVGEAAAIERLDQRAVDDYRERLRQEPCPSSCALQYQPAAARVMDAERRHTRELFETLEALALAMAPIAGPKALVLVSNGIVSDRETLDLLRHFGVAAERARVTLYGLNLESPATSAGTMGNMMGAHRRDHEVLLDGMTALAAAGRGDVFMVSGSPALALARIDAEMAGYYLLSFERDRDDRDGQRASIEVRVTSPNAVVRARTEFTPEKGAAQTKPSLPANLKATVGEMIRAAVPATDVPIDIDTYAIPSPAGTLRTILAASLESGATPIVAAGYEVTDEAGAAVADEFTIDKVSTEPLGDNRRLYAAALGLAVGRYRVKLAIIDAQGRRGSVEHRFEVRAERAGAIQIGDVIVGELSGGRFVPSPALAPGATALPVQLTLVGDTAGAFEGATLTLALGPIDGSPLATSRLSLGTTSDPRQRSAFATLAIGALPPGEYVAAARLRTADGAEATASRVFFKK